MSMTPRERVLTVLDHKEPDRPPVIIGVSNATSIKMPTYQKLKQLLGINAPDRYVYDWPELGTAELDEETLQALHSDVRGVWDREPDETFKRNREREPHSPYIDSWGSGQVEISPGKWFSGVHPLAHATTIEELEAYPWPNMDDPSRVAHVKERARMLANDGTYAIMATPWLLFPFERSIAMQGMEAFFVNMSGNPDFALALFRKTTDLCKTLMGHFLEEIGPNIDIIKIGDDLGTQTSLLISPKMYRRMLKPFHQEFISFIKERTHAKIFFHTDGDVFPLIPDFIEMGIDILNPVQTSAGRMSDLHELKKQFGKNIIFCGAIDTHRILPYGTPEEVRAEVHRVRRILGEGGGYMVASVHTILDDVPPENVVAMCNAAIEPL